MAKLRSGAGRYKKVLENLLMPDITEVLNMMDRRSVTYHRDIGATLQGLPWPNLGQFEYQNNEIC